VLATSSEVLPHRHGQPGMTLLGLQTNIKFVARSLRDSCVSAWTVARWNVESED
jgi:hypothetical protein